jgi:hypothetical protein
MRVSCCLADSGRVCAQDGATPMKLADNDQIRSLLRARAQQQAGPQPAGPPPPRRDAPPPPRDAPPPRSDGAPPPPPPKREPPPPPPQQREPPPPPPARVSPAVASAEAFERVMREEIDLLAAAIAALEVGEPQRGAARRLRKRYHPDSARDVTALLPARAEVYQRLSQHANAKTERFLSA